MTRSFDRFSFVRTSQRVSAGVAALAVTALTLATLNARAAEANVPRSISVQYSEVSLATAAGAASVYRKMKVAARDVCGVNNGTKDITLVMKSRQCYVETLAEAVRRVDRPQLTALHSASSRNLG